MTNLRMKFNFIVNLINILLKLLRFIVQLLKLVLKNYRLIILVEIGGGQLKINKLIYPQVVHKSISSTLNSRVLKCSI